MRDSVDRRMRRGEHFPVLYLFLLLYRILLSLGLNTAGRWLWLRALLASPVSYITNYNYLHVLGSPWILGALAVFCLGFSLWSLFAIVLTVLCLDCFWYGKYLPPRELLRWTVFHTRRALRPANLPLLPFAAVTMAVTDVFMGVGLLSRVTVPLYMMPALLGHPVWLSACLGAAALLGWWLVEWRLVFHSFVLEKCERREAVRRSRARARGNRLSGLLRILGAECGYGLRMSLGLLLLALAVCGVLSLFLGSDRGFLTALQVLYRHGAVPLFMGLVGCYVVYARFLCLEKMYRGSGALSGAEDSWEAEGSNQRGREDLGQGKGKDSKLPRPEGPDLPGLRDIPVRIAYRFATAGFFGFLAAAGTALVLVTEELIDKSDLLDDLVVERVQITGHRGYSSLAPENTIPAFSEVIRCGMADYAELDVRQTKDGVVVVSHDASLARCAGVNRKIADLTYEELKEMDASRSYRKLDAVKYAGTPVPTLDQVIKLCKGRLQLNIEIKGSSPSLVEDTLRVIRENEFAEECVITSQRYENLERVKELAPELRCGYTMGVGVGFYYDLPAADFFSIDSTFITPSVIAELHTRGKEVHAWDVKNERTIRRVLNLGVDNIITSDPAAVYRVLEREEGELLAAGETE